MKAYAIILLLTTLSHTSFTQTDCDTSNCTNYAIEGSYKILGFNEQSENTITNTNENYALTCEHLCMIEFNREDNEDIVAEIGPYTILVYGRNKESNY